MLRGQHSGLRLPAASRAPLRAAARPCARRSVRVAALFDFLKPPGAAAAAKPKENPKRLQLVKQLKENASSATPDEDTLSDVVRVLSVA